MENLMQQLFEKAKTNKDILLGLKNLAVRSQDFELASNFRDMEKNLFPETEEVIKAKDDARRFDTVLRMVDIKTTTDIAWLLLETSKVYAKKGGKFDLRDASKLKAEQERMFGKKSENAQPQ